MSDADDENAPIIDPRDGSVAAAGLAEVLADVQPEQSIVIPRRATGLAETPPELQLPPAMRVSRPNMREVLWDCPWVGHINHGDYELRFKNSPFVGRLCIKCGCLTYERAESAIVGPGGESLPAVTVPEVS